MSGRAADDGEVGWTLVQLSALVRRAEELLLDGFTLVGPHANADMRADAEIAVDGAAMRRVAGSLAEGVEIAEQLELLAERLPATTVAADYRAVSDAAAADLACGIVDPRRALLAARLLDVSRGWPALADALAAGDVVSTWEELTVEAMLRRFRAADPRVVERVAAEAGVALDTPFSACPPDRLAALADGLRRRAGEPPAS
jgi:hypothetical protein